MAHGAGEPSAGLWPQAWSCAIVTIHPRRDIPTALLGGEALRAVGGLCAPRSLASSLFPCSHLNAVELGAASFWLRVALGAAVTALVGFTLYRALAKNK